MDETDCKIAERYHTLLESPGSDPETCAKQVAVEFDIADWQIVDELYDQWLAE